MHVVINPEGKQPPSHQLKRQLREQIMARELRAGMQLPSVRTLAAELGLAPNTVAKVYRELESAGYLVTSGRRGTAVAAIAPVEEETQREAMALAADYVTTLQGMRLGDEAILEFVRDAL